jgi:hypothetical protein
MKLRTGWSHHVIVKRGKLFRHYCENPLIPNKRSKSDPNSHGLQPKVNLVKPWKSKFTLLHTLNPPRFLPYLTLLRSYKYLPLRYDEPVLFLLSGLKPLLGCCSGSVKYLTGSRCVYVSCVNAWIKTWSWRGGALLLFSSVPRIDWPLFRRYP